MVNEFRVIQIKSWSGQIRLFHLVNGRKNKGRKKGIELKTYQNNHTGPDPARGEELWARWKRTGEKHY